MGKSSKEAHGAKGTRPTLLLDPDDVVLVDDTGSAIYDERAKEEFEEPMVLNIMAYGVIEPIVVRKHPESGATECVAGRRRVINTREANRRLRKKGEEPIWIPAIVKRAEAHVLMGIMASENAHRKNETPLQKAEKVARFIDVLGRSEDEAAIMMGISVTTVKNLIRLRDAPAVVRKAVESGKIAATDGYKLSRLDPEEAKERLAALPPPGDRHKEGKPRASNGAARKERAENRETLGVGNGLRKKGEIKKKIEELQGVDSIKEMHRAGIEAALYWAMGDEGPLQALIG